MIDIDAYGPFSKDTLKYIDGMTSSLRVLEVALAKFAENDPPDCSAFDLSSMKDVAAELVSKLLCLHEHLDNNLRSAINKPASSQAAGSRRPEGDAA